MIRFILSLISLTTAVLFLHVGLVFASWDNPYTIQDGDTLLPNTGAFHIYGGFPGSGVAFFAAPWAYINIGVQLHIEYEPSFELSVPFKAQMLESDGEKFNLALTLRPGLYFEFGDAGSVAQVPIRGGVAMGWRFWRALDWFITTDYGVHIPVSEGAEFLHYPEAATGLEFPISRSVNLTLAGTTDFVDYNPHRFVYGGRLGFVFALGL